MLHARWLSTSFLTRHWGVILATVVLLLIYMTNRYQCVTEMETIQRLEKELQIVKSERIRAKSDYMSSIREESLLNLLHERGINIVVREQPPYTLEMDD